MRVKDEHSHSINTGRCRPTVAKSTLSSHSARIMNMTTSSTKRSTLSSRHADNKDDQCRACGDGLRHVAAGLLVDLVERLLGLFMELFVAFHNSPDLI